MATNEDLQYVSGAYIRNEAIEERAYQTALVDASIHESTLIALPTGTGKTAVGVRLAARRLDQVSGKVLMMAPTQPLVNQHAEFFQEALDIPDHEIRVFTGDIPPDEREDLWNGATSVVIATPQVIENDLIGNRYDLSDVCHIIFDECHRATGDYAYTYIAERYHGNATHPLATGLSASPGSSKEQILTISMNLGLTNIEVLTEEDDLLRDWLHETTVDYQWVDIPEEILEARDLVQEVYVDRLKTLKKDLNVLDSARQDLSISKLMKARGKIQQLIDNNDSRGYKAQSVHAEALKLNHGWRTIESQSPEAAISYFESIFNEARSSSGSKAAGRIASAPQIKHAISKLRDYEDTHPKLRKLRAEVARTLMEDGQALVFSESRDTVSTIVDHLDGDAISAGRFVGQSNKDGDPGMSQTQQKERIRDFRNGEFDVLVSTSVAEEGIDIPSVDLVAFYEPVPNAIRTIQRRGRTGRQSQGRVVVLIGKDTQDETAYYVSQRREDKMKNELSTLKEMEKDIRDELREEQASLADFGKRISGTDQPTVIIDTRETKSSIGKLLDRDDSIQLRLETIDVGDYIVSNRAAIERKELDDFIASLTGGDRDIFQQISELANTYDRPILIVEGGNGIEDLYGRSQVSEQAIRSAIYTIAVDFNVSIIFTQSEEETAKNVSTLARREQSDDDREINPHGRKETETIDETTVYVTSSLPDIGPVTAKNLLEEFGSVRNVFTASKSELVEVEGIGDQLATQIVEVLSATYSRHDD